MFKQIVSEVRKKTKGAKSGLSSTSSKITPAMEETLREIEKKNIITINATTSTKSVSEIIAEDKLMLAFPWGYKKKDIQKALEDNSSELYIQLNKAYNELKIFFTNLGNNLLKHLRVYTHIYFNFVTLSLVGWENI